VIGRNVGKPLAVGENPAENLGGTFQPARARRRGIRTMRGKVRRNLLWLGGALVLAMALAACGKDLPQNTFDPAGPTAQSEKDILILPLVISGFVFVLVEGGIVFLAIKFRHRKGRERMPTQLHGNTRLEIGWTIAPALLLAVVFVPAVSMIWTLAQQPADAMHINVKGYQWWWGFEYLDPGMQVSYPDHGPITTADVLVIPADTTIDLSLESAGGGAHDTDGVPDNMVVHSFWAPRLFGKQDVVPGASGSDNHIVFSAWDPGTYYGQCAEFCGLQHGMMKFRIVALDAADWQTWVANHKQPARTPTGGAAAQGMDLFLGTNGEGGQCIACHEVGGATAVNAAAPNLTDFADPTHQCFAGCDFEVFNPDGTPNVEALKAWLRDPNAVKLGAKMPDYDLSEDQIDALVAYLYSLS
jgi:cytochrome c oxidase subunit 2